MKLRELVASAFSDIFILKPSPLYISFGFPPSLSVGWLASKRVFGGDKNYFILLPAGLNFL
jgi:hypothetical protein